MGRPLPHWPRLTHDQAREVATRTLRVLRDSNRTLDIVAVEELVSQTQLRALLRAGVFDAEDGAALLAERPSLPDTDLDPLRRLPDTTLGGAFVRFLDENGLDLTLLRQPAPYTDDADAAFLLQRIRQSHDLWHTLLGLGTAGHEEILVHSFSLAQTGFPSSVMIVLLGGVKHLVAERRWRDLHPGIARAYQLGRRASWLLPVYWERYWEQPLREIRTRFGITPYAHAMA
ncbi:MAG: Coq4 family protein [Myxococcota bacterium]